MPVVKNREYRMLPMLQPTQNEKRINSDYYIEGAATTFNKPYELYEFDGVKYYEVIDRNALDGADMSDVIMQYNHEGRVLARNTNKTLGLEPNNDILFIYADLGKSKASKEMFEEIDSGLVTKMSWAFTVAEDIYNSDTRTRTITKVKKIYDVSAVSLPANNDTEISARSYVDGVIEIEKQEVLVREEELKLLQLKLEHRRELCKLKR